MWDLLKLVLDKLEIKSEATISLKNQIKSLQGRPDEAKALLTSFETEARLNNCTKCDSRHFRSFFLACIYYELDVIVQAQIYMKHAIKDFNRMGSKWNELLANWIYGETFILLERNMPARRELVRTIEMLQKMEQKFRREYQYKKRDECRRFIKQIQEKIDSLAHYL